MGTFTKKSHYYDIDDTQILRNSK